MTGGDDHVYNDWTKTLTNLLSSKGYFRVRLLYISSPEGINIMTDRNSLKCITIITSRVRFLVFSTTFSNISVISW